MSSGIKAALLALFIAAAWFRLTLGIPPPPGAPLSVDMVAVPPAPPGWTLSDERKLTDFPSVPGKAATYKAPDGSKLLLQTRIAWADRRNLPVVFFPEDCNFLGSGWNFLERGKEDTIAPGIQGHRIEVQRANQRLVLFSAYSCDGKVTGSWHDFKMDLIWQRIRRQRKLWVKSVVVSPPSGEGRAEAAKLLASAVTTGAVH